MPSQFKTLSGLQRPEYPGQDLSRSNQRGWSRGSACSAVAFCVMLAGLTISAFAAQSGVLSDSAVARLAVIGDSGGSQNTTRFTKPDHVLKFINDYRDNKQPARVSEAMHAMVKLGMLRDPEKAGIYVGFLAGVIGENQTSAQQLILSMFPLPPREQVVLIKAIAFSGLPEWKYILSRFTEHMPARKVLIKKYLYGEGKTLSELSPAEGPFVLDALWGYYFATGAWAPAQRIIAALALFQDKNDVEQRTIGAMVKWTLATNASRDKNLLDLAKSEMNHQPAEIRRDLREVIEAAELYEMEHLRKEAMASIEELKIKGPKRVRDWKTWGNAGTTALALGCVAAAVLGQAQLGIPCVVGGALSTAAVKYLGPKE